MPPETAQLPPVAILGAGWAGAAAALWAHRLGLGPSPWWAEGPVGGCLHHAHHAFWDRLGVHPGRTGPELAEALAEQLLALGLAPEAKRASGLRLEGPHGPVALVDAEGVALWAEHLVLAPGLRPRPWAVPGAQALEDRAWGRSASLGVRAGAGRAVAVVGGGDGAAEAAAMLAATATEVHWLLRAEAPRARPELVAAALALPQVRLHRRTWPVAASLAPGGLRLELGGAGPQALSLGWVVVKVGFAPATDWLRPHLALDAEGYAQVDAFGRSASHPRIYVVGDAASPFQASLAVAEGQAATALKQLQTHRRP